MFGGFLPVIKEIAKGVVMAFGWLIKKIASVLAPFIKPAIRSAEKYFNVFKNSKDNAKIAGKLLACTLALRKPFVS